MGLFGGMPFPVQFFLAFVIVLGLIGATAWAVRRFGAGRLGGTGIRGRQPRLAVVDYASVDGRRRLLLIRRDNVEHLVMIGGPTDVVVESNIVRTAAPPRDVPVPRAPAPPEALPRAIALPDSSANGSWAAQPEPMTPPHPLRMPRPEVAVEEPSAFPLPPQSESQPRPNRDTLAALADELSTRAVTPPARANRPPAGPRPSMPAPEPRQEVRPEMRPEPRAEIRPEPRAELRPEPRAELRQDPRPEPRQEPRIAIAQPAPSEINTATDQSLAEMAHRLEAALRKPNAKSAPPESRTVPMPRVAIPAAPAEPAEPAAEEAAPPPPVAAAPVSPPPTPLPRAPRIAADVKPSRTETKQPNPGKTLYDSLEQEMASLLGRPTVKH
jgi:flagellar protein FliO/FliZ